MVGVQSAVDDRTAATRADTIGLAGGNDGEMNSDSSVLQPSKRAKHAYQAAVTGTIAPHSVEAVAAPAPIKEDQGCGWLAEFQRLRQLPFDQAVYKRLPAGSPLHTMCLLVSGSRALGAGRFGTRRGSRGRRCGLRSGRGCGSGSRSWSNGVG